MCLNKTTVYSFENDGREMKLTTSPLAQSFNKNSSDLSEKNESPTQQIPLGGFF